MTPRPIVIQTAEAGPVWCWRMRTPYGSLTIGASRHGVSYAYQDDDPEMLRGIKGGPTDSPIDVAYRKHRELAKGAR